MKKIYSLLFLLFFFTLQAQIINIPDPNFKAKLLEASPSNNIAKDVNGNNITIDVNGDNEIQDGEALVVYDLRVPDSNISSLEGINSFENIRKLDCSGNQQLDSDFIEEISLIELTHLNCYFNNIYNLDLSGFTNLVEIDAGLNSLINVNLSGLTNLEIVNFRGNSLDSIDVSDNISLRSLNIALNDLVTLDLSNNYALEGLNINGNDDLVYLNIKNGNNYVTLYSLHNPFGDEIPENCFVCLDESDLDEFEGELPEGSFYSTYCSYSPGGINNIIEGTVIFDSNNNGNCEAGSEFINSHLQINISDGTETGHTFANNEGEYTFYVPEGNFTLTPEIIENPDYFIISPANANLNFPLLDGSTQTQNFCISPNGDHPDVEIIFSQLVPARPGFEASYRLVYRNKGNQTVSGTISLEYDEDKLDFLNSTVTPNNQSSGLLNYNFSNLNPFENRTIVLSFEVNSPTDTPPVNIGDNLPFSAQIDIGEDENPNDNSFELNQEVVGSFDPNDIACLQGESVAPEMIGEELHYRIRFENTGNFPAERVVVAMPINPEDYEVSSFQLLNTSHEVQARVVDNTAEFFFEEIDLGPNEEGDILFSIKSLESLQIGDSVMSYADIYFDYNYPITTNEAVTTFEIMRTKEVELSSVSIFPNPATTQFMIQSDYKINSVEIYDVAGRLIQVSKLNSNQSSQNISQLPKGMYILKIQTEKGLVSYKLIKK